MLSPSGQDMIFYLNWALRVGLENTRITKKSIGFEILSGLMSIFSLVCTAINPGPKDTTQVCHNQGLHCPTK